MSDASRAIFNQALDSPIVIDERYGRVTNPERFRLLHSGVLSMISRLEVEFDVERSARSGNMAGARQTIVLTPQQPECATIAVALTEFPGLDVRFGHWTHRAFPACGCDACNEIPEVELHLFESMVVEITAGRFREAVHAPVAGPAQLEWQSARSRGGWVH